MSDFTAIQAVTQTLEELIEASLPATGPVVRQSSPKEMQQNMETGISLWLYRITRNEHLLNQRPTRPSATQVERHCLPINLHYLITPILADPGDEQRFLGRILQIFNDHPTLRGSDLRGDLQGGDEELRVTLETLTLEELTRVWAALQEPYQTSLSYQVQHVCIDSDRQPLQVAPVLVRDTTYAEILSSS
jgi:hypothetical protein